MKGLGNDGGSSSTNVYVQSSRYQPKLLEDLFAGGNTKSVILGKSATSPKLNFTTCGIETTTITLSFQCFTSLLQGKI